MEVERMIYFLGDPLQNGPLEGAVLMSGQRAQTDAIHMYNCIILYTYTSVVCADVAELA